MPAKVKVTTLHRQTIKEARREKTGIYTWRTEEKPFTEVLDNRTPDETLSSVQKEVIDFLERLGFSFGSLGHNMAFDPPAGWNREDSQIKRAISLALGINKARREMSRGNLTPELLITLFALGRDFETWRVMPFNRPAAGGIRASVNTEEQQAKAQAGKVRGASIIQIVDEMREKHPGEKVQTIFQDVADTLTKAENRGKPLGWEAIKKRYQKAKKTLGK